MPGPRRQPVHRLASLPPRSEDLRPTAVLRWIACNPSCLLKVVFQLPSPMRLGTATTQIWRGLSPGRYHATPGEHAEREYPAQYGPDRGWDPDWQCRLSRIRVGRFHSAERLSMASWPRGRHSLAPITSSVAPPAPPCRSPKKFQILLGSFLQCGGVPACLLPPRASANSDARFRILYISPPAPLRRTDRGGAGGDPKGHDEIVVNHLFTLYLQRLRHSPGRFPYGE